MKRTIIIETSQFSDNPTTRWNYGGDYFEEDCIVEYDSVLDELSDDDLLELADNEDPRVRFVDE